MSQLRDRLTNAVKAAAARRGILLARYAGTHRRERLTTVRRVEEERTLLLSHGEACQLLACLESTARITGDVAELGVAYGASAKLLSMHLPPGKQLQLFDTFKGLPDVTAADGARFRAENSNRTSTMCAAMSERSACTIIPACFRPRLTPCAVISSPSYIWTRISTRAPWRHSIFLPASLAGGIMLCHDYPSAAGVVRAVEEFFGGKPDPVVELTGYQVMIVKLQRGSI